MSLRDIESTLPAGFRFYPSDEELVCHYLLKKVANVKVYEGTMVEVDLHTCEPWELPVIAKLGDNEWYFFSFRDRKYATGSRANRATKSGYWKATGKDRTIYNQKTHGVMGMRKTLVFYRGRAPNGVKTAWVMHEFRIENPHMPPKEDWVLCRVCQRRREDIASSSLQMTNSSPTPRPVDWSMLHGCPEMMWGPHQDGQNTNTNFDGNNLEALQYNFLGFTQDMDMTMGFKDIDDDYGLLLDMVR